MPDDGDDMITTTNDGETLLTMRLDWVKITEVACAIALGLIIALGWIELAKGGHAHG